MRLFVAIAVVLMSLSSSSLLAKKPKAAPPPCDFGDDAVCKQRCAAGNLESCYFDLRRHPTTTKQQDFVALCNKGQAGACNAAGLGVLDVIADRHDSNEEFLAARPLFEKGCAGGSAKACNNLGSFLRRESLGARELSLTNFIRSCELDDVSSLTGCLEAANQLRDGSFGSDVDLPRAAALYAHACKLGHASSCAEATRHGVPSSLSPMDDAALADRFCRRGDLRACLDRGYALWNGSGVAVDKVAADRVLGLACDGDQNTGAACGALGNLRLGTDWLTAAPPLTRACDHDHGRSCRRLADLVLVGHGVVADRARAVALYQKACAIDPPQGCTAVGDLAAESVEPIAWFTAGCSTGDNDACGVLARSGVDVDALKKQGEERRAAADEDACRTDSDGPACLRVGQRLERHDPTTARALYDDGCTAGSSRACRQLNRMLHEGRGGPKDVDRAIRVVLRGCTLGEADMCRTTKAFAASRRGPELDDVRAELAKACAAGVADACR